MLISDEIASRIIRLTTTDGLSVGDTIYWRHHVGGVGREDGIETVRSVRGLDAVITDTGAFRAMGDGSLWAKVHWGRGEEGTLAVTVSEPETYSEYRQPAGSVVTLTGGQGPSDNRERVGHARTEGGGGVWIGGYILLNPADVSNQEQTTRYEVVEDEPTGEHCEVWVTRAEDGGSLDRVAQPIAMTGRLFGTAETWWESRDGSHYKGAKVQDVDSAGLPANGSVVLVVSAGGVNAATGKFATVFDSARGVVEFHEEVPNNVGQRTHSGLGETRTSRWFIRSWVPARAVDGTDTAFVPTVRNPAPGIYATDIHMSGEYRSWLEGDEERRGFRGIQPVTITERCASQGMVGKNAYLVGVAPDDANRTDPFYVVVQHYRNRWMGQYVKDVVPGHDQPVGWNPEGGQFEVVNNYVDPGGDIIPAGTTGHASYFYVEGKYVEGDVTYPDGTRAWKCIPFHLIRPLVIPEVETSHASGQALTGILMSLIEKKEQEREALWARLDQAADDNDWCTEYEAFSDRVEGLARQSRPRSVDYEFRIQAEFSLSEGEADDALSSYFEDIEDADGRSIDADTVGGITVTNQFYLRYATSDPEDVDVEDILDHHGITAGGATIVSYSTID